MKLDGQLENAQLEEAASDSPTPAARSRVFSDITDTSNPIPRFHDSNRFVPFMLRKKQYESVSTTHTIAKEKEATLCNASGGAFTVTLPPAADMPGQVLFIKKVLADTTFNAVTIDGNASEQIDGASSITLNTRGEWVKILSLSTSWTVLERGYYAGKTAFTPTGTWSTNVTYTGYWWRTGDRINMEYYISVSGQPDNTFLKVDPPSGITIDTAKMLTTAVGFELSSNGTLKDTSVPELFDVAISYDAGKFYVHPKTAVGGGGAYVLLGDVNRTAPFTWASGDAISLAVRDVPVQNWAA
jgi:hypothetical protein